MPLDFSRARPLLHRGDLATLFVEELGWEPCRQKLTIRAGEHDFSFAAVAEKRGFVAWLCESFNGSLPDHATRLRLDRELTQTSFEHLVVFANGDHARQSWMWVRREPGRPVSARTHEYLRGQAGDSLLQKLQFLFVSLDEEEQGEISTVTIAGRARAAFDVERVTKRFFEDFRKQHGTFLEFIKGIPNKGDHEWYASVMLNRLMFLYFVQRKGFLDGDSDYLRNRLNRLKAEHGKDKFYSFYRYFLLKLFHGGLNTRLKDRQADLEKLLGRVPYLNGGIFDIHSLERTYGEHIQIPDKAFEDIFDYFEKWDWVLDPHHRSPGERPEPGKPKKEEINPDVLGYIFEKYINQKQMGAYYTKEDITEHIGQNTILPCLLDAVRAKQPAAFARDGSVWLHLQRDPDAYIYGAVRQGISWDCRPTHPDRGVPLEKERPLRPDIAAGLDANKPDLTARRKGWNKPADAGIGLPTETWREVIARRKRYEALRKKLAAGEVHDIADVITHNLDIRRFTQDVITRCDSDKFLADFWHALAGKPARKSNERSLPSLAILDPTCGSGAFLFAALNLLEPLYEACLDRMEGLLTEARAAGGATWKPHPDSHLAEFERILARVAEHHNERYFIYKTIILHNLYGVDLMEEAVEICKLRLFLKLAAQVEPDATDANLGIEPLPDIDFNIRAGNTLVGYASIAEVRRTLKDDLVKQLGLPAIEEKAALADMAYTRFREMQTQEGMAPSEFASAKKELRERLDALNEELNRYLASEYGVKADAASLAKWRQSHQPFHWFVEFFGIINKGGFDVIVGNPPYVNAAKVREEYSVKNLTTLSCPDIFAWVLERTESLLREGGRTGMIVPLSLGFSGDFAPIRELLCSRYGQNWFSSYGRIPSALFSFDVRVRNTIHIGHKDAKQTGAFTSRLHRWFEAARPHLFSTLEYASFTPSLWGGRIPKLNTQSLASAFERCLRATTRTIEAATSPRATKHVLHFKKTAYNWLNFCRKLPPCYEGSARVEHTQFGDIYFRTDEERDLAMLLCNGKLMFVFWAATCDDFHVPNWSFEDFPIDIDSLSPSRRQPLLAIQPELEEAMIQATQFKLNAGKNIGNYNLAKCRHVTDQSDRLFCDAIGLAGDWDDIELYCVQVVKTDFDEEE